MIYLWIEVGRADARAGLFAVGRLPAALFILCRVISVGVVIVLSRVALVGQKQSEILDKGETSKCI